MQLKAFGFITIGALAIASGGRVLAQSDNLAQLQSGMYIADPELAWAAGNDKVAVKPLTSLSITRYKNLGVNAPANR